MASGVLADAIRSFRERPSSLAVIENGRSWTWAEYLEEIERIAADLGSHSDRGPIGILLPSGSSFLATFLAAARLGRPACTLHPDWAEPELQAAIEDGGLSRIVTAGPERSAKVDGKTLNEGVVRTGEDPIFYIGFTSGTSGRPKPFARRWKSWSSSFEPAGELFSIRPGDVVFLPGSLQHSHFLFGAMLALNRGAAARLYEQFDPGLLAEELRRASRAVLYLVPTMLVDLDELEVEPVDGVHSLVISGSNMEAHHWEIARRLFPSASVGELYGASELSFVTVNTEGERRSDPGFVGRPFPGVEIEIRPLSESDSGPGVVYVRSPYLFAGYVDRNGFSSPVDEDGFMTVGDVGVLGDEGLALVGRASNLLITGGKNVHPEEVEARLVEHPEVRECVVAGIPHPRWGEEIVGFVVSRDTVPETGSLRSFLKERIASYKVPKRWFLVDEIPRTPANKTDRTLERLLGGATEL